MNIGRRQFWGDIELPIWKIALITLRFLLILNMHFVCSRGARRPPSRTCSTAAALFLQNAILVELHMKKLTFRGTPFKTLGFLKIVKNENMRKRPLSSKKQTSRLMSSKIEGPYGPFDFRRISLRRRPAAGRFALGIPFQ